MAKWLSEEALKIVEERREVKSKGERERYIQLNREFQRTAWRDKKASFNFQTRLLNKARRTEWGEKGPIQRRNKAFFGEEILISIFTWC